jgi:hypothetical protein
MAHIVQSGRLHAKREVSFRSSVDPPIAAWVEQKLSNSERAKFFDKKWMESTGPQMCW